MANWCENKLSITGDKKQLQSLIKKAKTKDTDFSMEKLFPMPKELDIEEGSFGIGSKKQKEMDKKYKRNVKKYGFKSWYDWRVHNWGTKWDIDSKIEYGGEKEDEFVDYVFNSAWSPPIEFLKGVSNKYPKLKFTITYAEEGMGFRGIAQTVNGEVNELTVDL